MQKNRHFWLIFAFENCTFLTSIFSNKLSFPAQKTTFTTKFRLSSVILLELWTIFPFTARATALSLLPFRKHVFFRFYDQNAFWEITAIFERDMGSCHILYFLVKSRASSEFCQNFTLVVFLGRHNSQKLSWQVREFAFGRAFKHTLYVAIQNLHNGDSSQNCLQSDSPRRFLSTSKLSATFTLQDAHPVGPKAKKGSKIYKNPSFSYLEQLLLYSGKGKAASNRFQPVNLSHRYYKTAESLWLLLIWFQEINKSITLQKSSKKRKNPQ